MTVSIIMFEQMTTGNENQVKGQDFQKHIVRKVSPEKNQFSLPDFLVRRIGFTGPQTSTMTGARVAWYYNENEDKCVLSDESLDRRGYSPAKVTSLCEIENDELKSGNVSGAKVTIISKLPDHIYDALTRNAEIILRPVYEELASSLDTTIVSVYPPKEYRKGELDSVEQTMNESLEEVMDSGTHNNSV